MFLQLILASVLPGSIGFSFHTDREEALYKLGQEAVFTVTATNGSGEKVTSGKMDVILDNYGDVVLEKKTIDLSVTNPFVVKSTLREPGFLRMSISGPGTGRSNCRWAVGYEPEKIRPAGTRPADFDEFWDNAVARLEKTVPLDPRLVHQPELSKGGFDFWRVSFATYGGTRVWGFLTVPKDRSKAPFPVSFEVPSAGQGAWTYTLHGRSDIIRMYMTVHHEEPPRTQEECDVFHDRLRADLRKKTGVDYYARSGFAGKREDAYVYRSILGINRAANWLWEQDYVDRSRFQYRGGSQGGGFGWFLCGLNPKFTSALLLVPNASDQLARLARRSATDPDPLPYYTGTRREAVLANLPYYDGASFAPRIKCPIRVVVGFIDNICPPSAVYATYNVLGSADKAIFNAVGKGHGGRTRHQDRIGQKWQESLPAGPDPRKQQPINRKEKTRCSFN